MAGSGSVAFVDDEPMLVRTYGMLMKRRNIPVAFLSCDADDAIRRFKATDPRPRVVIVDYRLAHRSGIDVLKAIAAEEPGTKVIMISGDETARNLSLEAGASLFLKKPAGIADITASIKALLAD